MTDVRNQHKASEKIIEMMSVLRSTKNVKTDLVALHFESLEDQIALVVDAWGSGDDTYIDNALSVLVNARFAHNLLDE